MPLVKFVEQNRRDAAQLRIFNHLPQQNTFGYKTNFRFRRRDVFKTDLITNFFAKFYTKFVRDARGEQASRKSARLQDDDLAVPEQTVFQQHLRHLRRFSGAGGCGQNQSLVGF